MNCKLYIYMILLYIVGSCNNNQPIVEKYPINYQEFQSTKTDSISALFCQKEFQATIDTFYFESESPPSILSFIEYYSVSTYSVSNIKCMMVGGKEEGIICLFKFNYRDKIWELERKMEIKTQRIKQIASTIKNSNYWLENDSIIHQDRFVGDFLKFGYVDNNDRYMRVNISPDVRLIDQIITLTKIDEDK